MPAASASVDRGEQADRPGAQRAQRGQHRTQQQRAAAEHERDRRQHARAAERPAEADRQPVPSASARPEPAVQDEAHEHTQRHERQAEHVALALVEPGRRGSRAGAARSEARGPATATPASAATRRAHDLEARLCRPLDGAPGRSLASARRIPRNFDAGRPEPACGALPSLYSPPLT